MTHVKLSTCIYWGKNGLVVRGLGEMIKTLRSLMIKIISKVYEEFRLNQNFTMMRNNIIFFSQLRHSIRCRQYYIGIGGDTCCT